MVKCMFVDDDALFLNLLQIFFGPTLNQYVSDPRLVPKILETQGPFDAMISDFDMPYQDGMLLVQEVHQLYPAMPIVMLSAHARPDVLPASIHHWILKPVDLDFLAQELQNITARSRADANTPFAKGPKTHSVEILLAD